MKKALIAAFLLLTASLLSAQALRLVIPFGHPRGVSALAFSPDGTRVLTGSDDGTAKLWDSEGREIQVFAEQSGQSLILSGGVSDVAFSPDGAMVLTAGPGSVAKLWDLEGRVLRVFAHGAKVSAVAFAPDGSAILTGGWDGTAKLWDLEGREIREFSLDQGGAMAIWSLAFSPDGQKVLAGGGDSVEGRRGLARLWDLAGREIQVFAQGGGEVTTVAFSPDGQAVLTGSRSENKLWRLDGQASKTITGRTLSLAMAPNGTMILTGNEDGTAQLWDLNSAILLQTFTGLREPVSSVAFAPDGRTVLAGSRDGTAHLWTLDGKIVQAFARHTSLISRVALSPDGKAIITGRQYLSTTGSRDRMPLRWDLTCRDVNTLANPFDNLYGDVRPLDPRESASALDNPFSGIAYSPDGKTKLVGGFAGKTELRDLDERVIQTFVGHSAYVAAVAFSPDGKTVLTGSWDGTAKLWDLSGQELATIIPLDEADWAVTTPSGLFDASPGAMRLMHYVVGLEAIDIEQLKGRYYEPGLLPKALGLVPGGLRLTEGMGELALHPSITSASIEGHTLRVQLQARSGGIGRVALLIDENIELEANANPQGAAAFEIDLSRFEDHFLPGQPNQLSLRTYNQEGWLKSFPHRLWYTPGGVHEKGSSNAPNTSATERRIFTDNERNTTSFAARNDEALCEITLYALIVGTSEYSNPALRLTYPDKDARAFSEALRATGEGLFCGADKVDIQLLTTSEGPMPRKAEIAQAMKNIASKAKPNDILLVYLSGHGIAWPPNSEQSRFHYLTTDVTSDKLEDEAVRNHLAISQDTLMAWMRGPAGVKARKRILILDACNSGQVVQTLGTGEKSLNSDQRRALELMNDRSGMFVLAGSAADKSSYEATSYGHGLLTYSLLKNMPEVAAKNDTRVEVYELFKQAFDEVPELAQRVGRVQKPEMIGSASYPIGRIDGDAPYPMPKALPVFLRCTFVPKGGRVRVRQPLSVAADEWLRELASEKKPRLAFWDLTEFEGDHYAIDGAYSVEGNTLSGSAQLYKKDEIVGEIPFSGPLDGLEEVAEGIVAKVLALLPRD